MKARAAGFTLLEVLIALLVLGVGLLALVRFQSTLAHSATVAKQRTEAAMLAQREIETLRSFVEPAVYDAYFAEGSPVTGSRDANGESASFAITWTLTDNNKLIEGRYALAEVMVAWTDAKGEAHSVSLTSNFSRTRLANSGVLLMQPPDGSGSTLPTICPAGTSVDWTVDNLTCSGTIPAAGALGRSVTVSAVTNSGSNEYVCQADGTWSAVASYPMSCTASCPAQTRNWSGANGANCAAMVAGAAHGAIVTVQDAIAPVTGSATLSCSNGNWTLSGTPSCTASCAAESARSWGSLLYNGINQCQGNLMTATDGSAPQVFNHSISGVLNASASYACTNAGSWSLMSGSSCAFVQPSGADCLSTAVSWTVGAETCSATLPQTASGLSHTALLTQGSHLGQATFACSSGSWQSATNTACAAACLVNVSGNAPNDATTITINGAPAACTVSSGTYACNSVNTIAGATLTIGARTASGAATGKTKALSGVACGSTYKNQNLK